MAELPTVSIEDIEVSVDDLDPQKAAAIYKEHGALVVRGLMKPYYEKIAADINGVVDYAIDHLDEARKVTEGWTVAGCLFLPAPEGYEREQQIMTVNCSYATSAAFFHSAFDGNLLDIVEAIVGPNVELMNNGQVLCKEPVGGHPKHLHQDGAYFEHKYDGPVGVLSYCVDTDLTNGALHVVPGSHKFDVLEHIDTFSHLGLDPDEWPWERALPITGSAGDSIFFNVKTIHGSRENNSNARRPVFIHRYRRYDDFIIIGGTTAENRAENAKHKDKVQKENQRGIMVRGTRPPGE